jgi:hypothetical protein
MVDTTISEIVFCSFSVQVLTLVNCSFLFQLYFFLTILQLLWEEMFAMS